MTINQILDEINVHKACSLPQVKRYLKAAGISPLGARQRPQPYPEDSGKRILVYLGFSDSPATISTSATVVAPPAKPRQVKLNGKVLPQSPEAKPTLKLGRVVSLKKLQGERSKSQAVAK